MWQKHNTLINMTGIELWLDLEIIYIDYNILKNICLRISVLKIDVVNELLFKKNYRTFT